MELTKELSVELAIAMELTIELNNGLTTELLMVLTTGQWFSIFSNSEPTFNSQKFLQLTSDLVNMEAILCLPRALF